MILNENYKFMYIQHCQKMKGLDKKTIKAYRIDLKQFYVYMSNKLVDKNLLQSYLMHLHDKYKPKTVKRKIASIHAFFIYLEMEEIVSENPLLKVRWKFKEPKLLPKTIPIEDVRCLLNYLQLKLSDEENKDKQKIIVRDLSILQFLFSTGLRISEVCNLKQENINLDEAKVLVYGKGSKERVLQIEQTTVLKRLLEYQQLFQEELLATKYFFVNRLGHHISDQSVRFMINKYSKSAGISLHITPHMFRHTFATQLLEEDVDIRYIQSILGHSSITTTQIYTHVTSNKQKEILLHKNPIQKLQGM